MGFPFLFNFGSFVVETAAAVETAAVASSVVVLCGNFLLGQYSCESRWAYLIASFQS